MTTLSEHLFEYMAKKINGFTKMKKAGGILFTCPNLHKHRFPSRTPTATYLPNSEKITCLICSWKGNQYDIVRTLEEDKKNWSDAEITNYLIQDLHLSMYKELESYEKYGWSLIPLLKNSKDAFEKGWRESEHKDKIQWVKWLNNNLNIGCFDDKTKILTNNGWKYFKDLDKTEKVVTLNPKTKQIEYQKPLSYINAPYYGNMYRIKSKTIDMLVTPNHRVYLKTTRSKTTNSRELFIRADDLNYERVTIPITGKWKGIEEEFFYIPQIKFNNYLKNSSVIKIKMDDWLEFLGWYISEGNCTKDKLRITIYQSHKNNFEKSKKIESVLKRLPFKYHKIKQGYVIYSKQLGVYLYELGLSYQKFIPNKIKNLSIRQLTILYTSLMLGDGNVYKGDEFYHTTSYKLAEDIQEIIFKMGFCGYIYKREPRIHRWFDRELNLFKKITGKHFSYTVIKQTRKNRDVKKKNINKEIYSGNIYCVETFNGIIYVKRNEHCYWSGNSNCEKSGIMVVDVDCKKQVVDEESKKLREEIITICEKEETLVQKTPSGGKHYIFLWEEELRKQVVNGAGTQIDTRTEGQIVVTPSKINNIGYEWVNLGVPIKKMSDELKHKLLKFYTVEKGRNIEKINTELDLSVDEDLKEKPILKNNLDGCCNDSFTKLGGVLTKLGIIDDKRATILHYLNKNWLESPMDPKAINGMLGSLSGYELSKEENHETAIYEYLKLVQSDISARDIMDSLKLPRSIVDKYLSKFVKEGKAIRMGRGRYQYKEKIEWLSSSPEIVNEISFKMPLFHDIAIFEDADCLILGGKTNEGKTTIALNILKKLIEQNITPYYIYNEAGSRFQKTAKLLGIDGKFYHSQHSNPLAIELERNACTILDWLCLENKADTDVILKHINDELQRKRGILIIFTQLKQDYNFFAPNLIEHFPTFSARYIQNNELHTEGYFQCDKIKEPRGNYTNYIIPCEYDRETRIFKPKDII